MKTLLIAVLLLSTSICYSQNSSITEITKLNQGKTVYDLDVSKERTMLAYGVGNRVIILNTNNINDSTGIAVPDKVTSIDISEDSTKVAFGTMTGKVGIIDIKSKTIDAVFTPHKEVVTSARLINNNKGIVSGSYDCNLCYTDIESKKTSIIQKFEKEINSIAVQDSLHQFITIGGDGMLNIWNSKNLQSIGKMKVDNSWGRDLVYWSSKRISTCGDAGIIRTVNIGNPSMPYEEEKEKHTLSRIYSVDILLCKYGNISSFVDEYGKIKVKLNVAFNETIYGQNINDLAYRVRFIGNSESLIVAVATQKNGLCIIPVSKMSTLKL
jgi:FOG: WD40 repeat